MSSTPTLSSNAKRALACFVVSLIALGACSRESTGPSRTVASVAAEVGDSRITTNTELFAEMLAAVNFGNKVFVVVRSTDVPVLDRAAVLAHESSSGSIMLLPAASDTATNKRSYADGSGTATQTDRQAVSEFLKAQGATNVVVYTSLPFVQATLPRGTKLKNLLAALVQHPNFDWVAPDQPMDVEPLQ